MTEHTTSPVPPTDVHARPLESLRVSVTDRCNLRCLYCMPEEEYVWLPRASILDYEEIARLVASFTRAGVTQVRITGGEPLLRRDPPRLVALLRSDPRIRELAMTTNGLLLARYAADLLQAGLDRVTVSLDTLRADRFAELARRSQLGDVLDGIDTVASLGFRGTKVNTVVMRGFNDDELIDLLEFGRVKGVEVRFIEYMDVGGATQWSSDRVVPRSEILDRLRAYDGGLTPIVDPRDLRAPADRFRLSDGTTFGIVASTTAPFCATCGRSRLTADGVWFLCLYADRGVDLKTLLRGGASEEEIAALIAETWGKRADRGAEDRLTQIGRGPLHAPEILREDPHREMHTRGG